MEQHWLTIIILLLILVIVFDGIRRMRRARQDSIKMSLRSVSRDKSLSDKDYNSEFPNGGARPSARQIDPERIQQVRSKYNFGDDLSDWSERLGDKLSQTIDKLSDDTDRKRSEDRVELSFNQIMDAFEAESVDEYYEDNESAESLEDYGELETSQSSFTDDDFSEGEAREARRAKVKTLDNMDVNQRLSTGPNQDPDGHHEESYNKKTHSQSHHSSKRINKKMDSGDQQQFSGQNLGNGKVSNESSASQVSIQANLNLEDSVPMLMDTLDQSDVTDTKASVEVKETKIEGELETIVPVSEVIKSRQDKLLETDSPTTDGFSANKPRYESKYADDNNQPIRQSQSADVLVIHLKAPAGECFYGSDFLQLILDSGLRYGDMNIFHRHAGEDGRGPILFSMANMVKPGTFDLRTFETFTTIGLSFFLTLPSACENHLQAFENMLSTAQKIANALSAELKDEQRSALTKQTIEHYRERVRDFVRRQQLGKNR